VERAAGRCGASSPSSAGYGTAMPTVDIAGRPLHYLRSGSGPPLLLIQGMSGTHLSWGEPLLEQLRPVFDVITYDHRGIGHSGPVTEPFTIAELAEDAVALLDALEVETAHVLGISMGGMVAQELVLAAPDRVRTLAIGCSYCGGPGAELADPADLGALFEAMQSGDRERAIRAAFEINVSPAFQTDEHYATFHEMALALPAPVPVILLQAQAISTFATQERLSEVDAPTLVLHGDVDRMLPFPNGELIAARIPGARLERYAGVGHLFWAEDPDRTAALLREHAGV
jgi:3-oxoadipate enol-lactonase